jgi:hypothetical protein
MPFNHPALFWIWTIPTLGVVALPVLIHLINMLRQRRVEWAAMEFLRLSQKKNRTWILLKQLLLLLVRMIAVATVVLIVAQPLLRNQWGSLLGSTTTHHILLLDDSFSMSDHWADTSALGEAKKVIRRLGANAAEQAEAQAFTLLRFSRAGRIDRGTQPDLLKEPLNRSNFAQRLDDVLTKIEASQTAAGPIEALKAIGQLLGEGGSERRIVYLISDFRSRDWDDPTDARKLLAELSEAGAEIHLVNCVEQARPNLAIAALAPAEGIQAAGVPFFMEVSVQNFGKTPAKDVPLLLEEDGRSRPAVTIARIPPERTVKERFLVDFLTAGEHQITARLESDAVAADNVRYSTIHLPGDVPVLLVDGDPDAAAARYLSVASAPGGPVRTGIRPQIETSRYLSLRSLDEFQAINLCNLGRLDKSAIDAVERFAAAGGGVAVFLGERDRGEIVGINAQWCRDGEGFFPVPLRGPAELLVDRLERAPDIDAEDHFIFRVFADPLSNFLSAVVVQNYFAVPDGWQPKSDSTTQVIARLRNGAPLVVERSFGKGRVVAFLTTAAPLWNNWARNPSFVVVVQDLQAYLARRPAADMPRQVGTPLKLKLDAAQYQPAVRFANPGDEAAAVTINATPAPGGSLAVALPETDRAGYYEARLTRSDGSAEVRRYALNVDAEEGNLDAVSGAQLAARLEGVKYQYEQAAAFQYTAGEFAGYDLSQTLLYVLVGLLICEQILAFSASYHPPRRQPAAAAGGAP